MSKTTRGVILMGVAVMLGFGTCAVFAATYGEAGAGMLIGIAVAILLSLGLFLAGIGLIIVGVTRK